jgi:hypothetical protein
MHWLIPAVSHGASASAAWLADTITPAGLLISVVLAASQSLHLWAIFYGFFVSIFLAGTGLSLISRQFFEKASTASNGRSISSQRATWTAASFLANLLVVAALVPLHQYYLKQRLVTVPWYHIFRSKSGCLPVPSRSLTKEFQNSYTFLDALGNQLPFGILVSYALAMANTFICSFGKSTRNPRIFAGLAGAFVMSMIAAYGMPLCQDDREGGTQEVTMHVDRTPAWEERTSMTWSWEARYLNLVGCVTAVATVGIAIVDRAGGAKLSTSNVARSIQQRDRKTPASSPNEKSKVGDQTEPPAGNNVARRDVVALVVNLALTGVVVLVMAVWSYMDVVWDLYI